MIRQKEFKLQTKAKIQFLNITSQIKSLLEQVGVKEGICLVYIPHTTAGVAINEAADPSVVQDIIYTLNKIVPEDGFYTHAEGNSPAHLKAVLTGSSVQIPISGNRLLLGTWQGVFFCEYDGPRQRTVKVTFLGEA